MFLSQALLITCLQIVCYATNSTKLQCPDGCIASISINETIHQTSNNVKVSGNYVWIYGFISVTVISLCSLIGVCVRPLIKKPIYNKILLYLITLSVGTLAGIAIFQLIPESLEVYNKPRVVWCSLVAVIGVYIFYLVENTLENLFKTRKPESQTNSNPQGSLPGVAIQSNDFDKDSPIRSQTRRRRKLVCDLSGIKPVAWMITVGNSLHSFIDGMAIGASFVVSPVQGFSTSLAIFCEEFLHEIGDFTIMVNAGMSIKQAAIFNFGSACCCYLGLIVGIMIRQSFENTTWVFALAGGVFLYISFAEILPEAKSHSLCPQLIGRPWLCFWLQNAGLVSGFVAMFMNCG